VSRSILALPSGMLKDTPQVQGNLNEWHALLAESHGPSSSAIWEDPCFLAFSLLRAAPIEAVLADLALFFGSHVEPAMRALRTLAHHGWFASSAAAFQELCSDIARSAQRGYDDCRPRFALCFGSTAPDFVLCRWSLEQGATLERVGRSNANGSFTVGSECFSSLAQLAQGLIEAGSDFDPSIQWLNDVRRQEVLLEAQAYLSGGAEIPAIAVPLRMPSVELSSSTSEMSDARHPEAKLSVADSVELSSSFSATPVYHGPRDALTGFTGHSYRFVREVHQAYPDPSCVPWTQLLQWVIQLPSTSSFAAGERRIIFHALTDMFVLCGRQFALQLIDESFLPVEQRTLRYCFGLTYDISPSDCAWRNHCHDRLCMRLAGMQGALSVTVNAICSLE
jgi:hypothetical protein